MFSTSKPTIRQRSQHSISRKLIDPDALNVLYRLSGAGFTAYLVGGGVRDLLLGLQPKDFDVSTNASPREIKRLFRNAFLIGKRFRLALIRFGTKQIETSTFRREPDPAEVQDDSRPGALYRREDNNFGTPAEDARRRDFTVNGLFYDIRDFSVIDYVGGLRDLERKILRSIGDPNIRFREDPVRMLRAVRFSARLGFRIHRDSDRAIQRHYGEIAQASKPRLFDELLKLFGQGAAAEAFRLLWSTRLMSVLLPVLHDSIERSGRKRAPLWKILAALDARDGDPVAGDSALRLATLLCPLYEERLRAAAAGDAGPSPEDLADRLVEEVIGAAFSAPSWRPPRAVCEQAAAMLSAQAHFAEQDARLHRARVFTRSWFPGALLLYHLRMEAAGADATDARGWSDALEQYRVRHRAPTTAGNGGHPPPAEPPVADVAPDGSRSQRSGRRPRRRRRSRRPDAVSGSAPETSPAVTPSPAHRGAP